MFKAKLLRLCLLLVALVGVSVQQCTIEGFEDMTALDTLQTTEANDASQTFTINRTIYNCLSTSQLIGVYNSMSVSILYIRSDTPNQLREVRYNMVCSNGNWARAGEKQSTALVSNDTRRDCSACTNQSVNEYHCTSCNSSCTGLNQCYGPGADECCSYNDDGNCVADCGMNREGNSTFECVCSNFWTGADCDACNLNCMNGGTPQSDCSTCQCVPGYNGTLCDVNINECSPDPCLNNGTCADGINSYNCSCNAGYTGTDCEINIDECSPDPCQNNGACTDRINYYSCLCAVGFTGTNCETNINECSPDPCQNGATCTDGINSYSCSCVAGYTGTNCEININECSPNPCQNGATCIDEINSYTCSCVAGYTGTNCEINIDKCSPNPCQNDGRCTDLINDYNCTCDPVYSGRNCSECAIPNCERCKASNQSAMGECTKCIGVLVLDKGTCNDNCGIDNCISCNKMDIECVQCQEGYREDNGGCTGERPSDEEQENDDLGTGSIIGIIIACVVTALLIIILIILAIITVSHERKKQTGKTNPRSTNPNLISRYRGNYSEKIKNPVFIPPDTDEAIPDAAEEKIKSDKNKDDETARYSDEEKDEKESLKEEYSLN